MNNNTNEMTSSELQNLTWVKGQPVQARLLDAQLWSEFLAINNEMIVTKTGRLVYNIIIIFKLKSPTYKERIKVPR